MHAECGLHVAGLLAEAMGLSAAREIERAFATMLQAPENKRF
jgi:hypothetical protein